MDSDNNRKTILKKRISRTTSLFANFPNQNYSKLEEILSVSPEYLDKTINGGEKIEKNTICSKVDKDTKDDKIEEKILIGPPKMQKIKCSYLCKSLKYSIINYLLHHRLWILFYISLQIVLVSLVFVYKLNEDSSIFGTITIANLLVDTLVRCEILITILHRIVVKIPFFKYFFNRMLHSIGGLHVGCGISLVFWLIMDIIFINNNKKSAILNRTLAIIILVFLVMVAITAIPPIRRKNHNVFERFHRYIGWFTLFVLIGSVFGVEIYEKGIDQIYKNPNLYMIIIITILIFHPWFFVRKLNVRLDAPSKQCTKVNIENIKQTRYHGRFIRVSKNLREWHAFAIALSYPDVNEIAIVVASAGDWTKNLIARSGDVENHINKLYVRTIFGTGFMYSINAYKCVVIIATGSGIAPVLPYIQTPMVESHIFWIAKDHANTYGKELMDLIQKHPHLNMIDTGKDGRPKVEHVLKYYRQVKKAQAIFIVSNEKFTNETIDYCYENGIDCYGALFDS